MKTVTKFLKNKSGATAIEYGLIAALIAVAVIGGVGQLGNSANSTFMEVQAAMYSRASKIAGLEMEAADPRSAASLFSEYCQIFSNIGFGQEFLQRNLSSCLNKKTDGWWLLDDHVLALPGVPTVADLRRLA